MAVTLNLIVCGPCWHRAGEPPARDLDACAHSRAISEHATVREAWEAARDLDAVWCQTMLEDWTTEDVPDRYTVPLPCECEGTGRVPSSCGDPDRTEPCDQCRVWERRLEDRAERAADARKDRSQERAEAYWRTI